MSEATDLPGSVAICIASCRRPDGLRALLRSISRLVFEETPPPLRVVVADNDPAGSARAVCEEAMGWLGHRLEYLVEPQPGIPQARNASLSRALGNVEWVALVDDDETVEPGWLDRLLSAQRRSRADAVTGPVLTRFEVEPPPWFRAGGFLTYPRYADGESRPIAYTNNVLVRARCLEALGALFDETMTFGTDSELFARFTDRGYRIVWADDARVEESVPSDRIRLGYLLRRSLREGLALVRLERRLERRGLGGVALRGLARLVEGIAGAVVPLPRCLAARAESLRTAAYGLGRLVGLAEWLASVDRGPATISPDA